MNEIKKFWTLANRQRFYKLVLGAVVLVGVQQGILTAESATSWSQALVDILPMFTALGAAIGQSILALKNPTHDREILPSPPAE